MANLCHSGAFHLDRQHRMAGSGQQFQQQSRLLGARYETIAAGNQPMVNAGFGVGFVSTFRLCGGKRRAVSIDKQIAKALISNKPGLAVRRHLVPREQRRHIQVVLQKIFGNDYIANLDACAQTTGHACENHLPDAKALDQCSGGGGGCDLADLRQSQNHRFAMQRALPELTTGMGDHAWLL